MSEKHRHQLYEWYTANGLDEEATAAVMSNYPARDVEEPVTREFLQGELALSRLELREEMGELREELRGEMGELREELRGEIGAVKTELESKIETMGTTLEAKMDRQFNWLMTVMISVLLANVAAMVTLVVAVV